MRTNGTKSQEIATGFKLLRQRGVRSGVSALIASVALLSGCEDASGPPPTGVPEEFRFSQGGFGMASTIVELHGDTLLKITIPRNLFTPADTARTQPSVEEWEGFWYEVHAAGIKHWRRQYLAEGVVDGSGWSLHIRWGRVAVSSQGSNAYPNAGGHEHELHQTPAFARFVGAVGALMDR